MDAKEYKSPSLAADAVVLRQSKKVGLDILLVKRKNPPYGWAFPGGFIDVGETCENAARRELEEETGLKSNSARFLCIADDPARDPRQHVISTVYVVNINPGQTPVPRDDAKEVKWFNMYELPELAFDHLEIIKGHICYDAE